MKTTNKEKQRNKQSHQEAIAFYNLMGWTAINTPINKQSWHTRSSFQEHAVSKIIKVGGDNNNQKSPYLNREGLQGTHTLSEACFNHNLKVCHFVQSVTSQAVYQLRNNLEHRQDWPHYYHRSTEDDFWSYRCLFFDIDSTPNLTLEKLKKKLKRLGILKKVRAIIQTSPNHFHIYIKITPITHHENPQEAIETCLTPTWQLAFYHRTNTINQFDISNYKQVWLYYNKKLKGDPSVHDTMRIAQTPGYLNPKNNFKAKLVYQNKNPSTRPRSISYWLKRIKKPPTQPQPLNLTCPTNFKEYLTTHHLQLPHDLTGIRYQTLKQLYKHAPLYTQPTTPSINYIWFTIIHPILKTKTSKDLANDPTLSKHHTHFTAYILAAHKRKTFTPITQKENPKVKTLIQIQQFLSNPHPSTINTLTNIDPILSYITSNLKTYSTHQFIDKTVLADFFIPSKEIKKLKGSHNYNSKLNAITSIKRTNYYTLPHNKTKGTCKPWRIIYSSKAEAIYNTLPTNQPLTLSELYEWVTNNKPIIRSCPLTTQTLLNNTANLLEKYIDIPRLEDLIDDDNQTYTYTPKESEETLKQWAKRKEKETKRTTPTLTESVKENVAIKSAAESVKESVTERATLTTLTESVTEGILETLNLLVKNTPTLGKEKTEGFEAINPTTTRIVAGFPPISNNNNNLLKPNNGVFFPLVFSDLAKHSNYSHDPPDG